MRKYDVLIRKALPVVDQIISMADDGITDSGIATTGFLKSITAADLANIDFVEDDSIYCRARKILMSCSTDVIRAITVIMIIGRDALPNSPNAKDYPCKSPEDEFMSLYKEIPYEKDPANKWEDVDYIAGKRPLVEYLTYGKEALKLD